MTTDLVIFAILPIAAGASIWMAAWFLGHNPRDAEIKAADERYEKCMAIIQTNMDTIHIYERMFAEIESAWKDGNAK